MCVTGCEISRDETKSRETSPHNSTVSGRACALDAGLTARCPLGRVRSGDLDHLGCLLAISVIVARSTTSLDEEQNGGQKSDEDAT